MIKKLIVAASLAAVAVTATPTFASSKCGNSGVEGDNLSNVDPFFYNGGDATKTTDSGIPHLPTYYGHMSTNNTYRFINIGEQVVTMIGDGKHGLWRTQDNGTVREYLAANPAVATTYAGSTTVVKTYTNKNGNPINNITEKKQARLDVQIARQEARNAKRVAKGKSARPTITSSIVYTASTSKTGLAVGADYSTAASVANYTHLDAAASWGAYRADGNQVNDNGTPDVTSDDYLNYVDLPITHAKYAGAYDAHVAIDLPSYYCTMSGPEYAYARAAMLYAFGQAGAGAGGAGNVGTLGKRAGLDVTQNYTKILQLKTLGDGRIWVNAGGALDRAGTVVTDTINYQPIALGDATTGLEVEYYLVERPFFNEEYLFIIAVFDDAAGTHEYIRPNGAYYDSIVDRANDQSDTVITAIPNTVLKTAAFAIDSAPAALTDAKAVGLYGVHHPATGACPSVGGDFGAAYYGGSWPTAYQEVTPLCDAVVVDIKFYANLDGRNWGDADVNLANATIGGASNTGDLDGDASATTRGYTTTAGTYGDLSAENNGDAWLLANNPHSANASDADTTNDSAWVNPEQTATTGTESKTYPAPQNAPVPAASLTFTPSL